MCRNNIVKEEERKVIDIIENKDKTSTRQTYKVKRRIVTANLKNDEIHKDCFAYRSSKKDCSALDELYCKKEECRFYKKSEDLLKEKQNMMKKRGI